MLNNRERRPTHPGEILREDILPAAGLTQTELARQLGISRRSVSQIVHERRPVTADMAHRLARVFDNTPEFWLNLQQAVDVWEELKSHRSIYKQIRPLRTASAAQAAPRTSKTLFSTGGAFIHKSVAASALTQRPRKRSNKRSSRRRSR
jgi:antitoxin HigA-1